MVHFECSECREKDPTKFGMRMVNGRKYPRHLCQSCWAKYSDRIRSDEGKRKRIRKKDDRDKVRRASGINIGPYVLRDSRKSDKRNGRLNDLDIDFVNSLISKPCIYCGETELRMTLDRIDNSIGHLKGNVVSACIRCNYARRSMPYEAWLLVSKGMKEARESNLFGDWTGRAR